MGSVSLSGFNNIDFSSILTALMKIERQPLDQLEATQRTVSAQQSAFSSFATKLAALKSAGDDLEREGAFTGRASTVSDTTALSASVGATTPVGSYEVVVNTLARAQVTTTSSTHADKDSTIVASGGTLQIGSKTVTLGEDVTLQGLADAINNTTGMEATAAIVKNGANYQLVLTGKQTGAANSFAITNTLTGGSGVALNASNTQNASDATGTVNGVAFSSTTNSVDGALPGSVLTLMKANPGNAIMVSVTKDSSSLKGLVQKFVTAYNDVVALIDQQQAAFRNKETNNIGGDSLIRTLRTQLSSVLNRSFGSGPFEALAQVGFSFSRTGQLEFREAEFNRAMDTDAASVEKLFRGDGGSMTGVFQAFTDAVDAYTRADGLVPNAQARLTEQAKRLAARVEDMEARLALKRAALQREFTAADNAIAQLNQASGTLTQIANQRF